MLHNWSIPKEKDSILVKITPAESLNAVPTGLSNQKLVGSLDQINRNIKMNEESAEKRNIKGSEANCGQILFCSGQLKVKEKAAGEVLA